MKETEKELTLKEFKEAKEHLRQRIKEDVENAMQEFYDKTGGIYIEESKVVFETGYTPSVYLNILL